MLSTGFFALAISLAAVVSSSAALWPQPRHFEEGAAVLKIASDFNIRVTDFQGSQCPKDLESAIATTLEQLHGDKLEDLVPDRGASQAGAISRAPTLKLLQVKLAHGGSTKSISDEAILPLESRQEGYSLTVPADGSDAVLVANTTLGLFRGLTTFGQMWYELDSTRYTSNAPFKIDDSPAYKYRGFMLDTARNYFPVQDIKRTIDAMSYVKLNTLHWHVVDSQSFPLEIPGFGELAAKGAYHSDKVYTLDNVQDIVSYAAARGIDVIGEIDTPGHTAVIAQVHPEHIACAGATPWSKFANEPPAGQLRLANPATQNFTANMLSAASKMFLSSYFGTGGDEINAHCYETDKATQDDLTSHNLSMEAALDKFTQASHAALKSAGKTAVVWEEMVLDHPVKLDNDAIVMVWINSTNAAAVAAKGHKVVHAPSDYFYLDCGHGGWVGAFTGNSWCDPFKSWQYAYTFDPVANITKKDHHLVMGGQSLLWTEQASPENLDSLVWPRAAASAEVFWSGPGGDLSKAGHRMHTLVYRLRTRGIKATSIQPEWCALRDGACDLTA